MELQILNMFKILEIYMKNCRGQSYDNSNNMSGIYSSLQSRIKRKSKKAEFVLHIPQT